MLALRLFLSFAIALVFCACGNAGSAVNDIETPADGDSLDVVIDADLDPADGETWEEDTQPDGDPDLDEVEAGTEWDAFGSDGDFDESLADHELLDGDDDGGSENGDDDLVSLALFSLEPSSGGASSITEVDLSGAGFAPGMIVQVGGVSAPIISLSSETATALFPPVALSDRGIKEVRVLRGEAEAVLSPGFEYLFDENPVVFVHGYVVGNGTWNTMLDRFRALGYPDSHLAAIRFSNSIQGNIVNARDELAPFVEQVLVTTGAQRVDVVCHSMGCISSRLWISQYGGAERVRDWVSLSGTSHGSNMGWFTSWLGEGGEEMYPAYANQEQSINGVQWTLNGDPDLADVDETPFGVEDGGGIHYHSIWSDSDGFIVPAQSQCLNQQFRNDCSDPLNVRVYGIFHMDMITVESVFQMAAGFLMEH